MNVVGGNIVSSNYFVFKMGEPFEKVMEYRALHNRKIKV